MEGESAVTRTILNELHSWDIQGDEIEVVSGVTRSIIDEVFFWDIQEDQREGESMVLLKESSMNIILGTSKEIK